MIFYPSQFMLQPKTDNSCFACGKDMRKKVYNKVVCVSRYNQNELVLPDKISDGNCLKKKICSGCYRKFPAEYIIAQYSLKPFLRKRYYYHLTRESWGDNITLSPRSNGCNRADDEPDIPRICVSSDVAGCLVSVYCSMYSDLNIYRTENEVEAFKTYNIPDSCVTNEHWLLQDTKFILFGRLRRKILVSWKGENLGRPPGRMAYGDWTKESVDWQKKTKSLFEKRLEKPKYWKYKI